MVKLGFKNADFKTKYDTEREIDRCDSIKSGERAGRTFVAEKTCG
jgi:hypothetical protein